MKNKLHFLCITCFLVLMMAATTQADTISFDMNSPAFEGGSVTLNNSIDGKTDAAHLTSGTDSNDDPFGSSIFETPDTLGLGNTLSDLSGFSFDYYIGEASNMSGGARMQIWNGGVTGAFQFDGLYKLSQSTETWLSSGNILGSSSPANSASSSWGLYTGYKTWNQIIADHGDLEWSYIGILQDNPSGSSFYVSNIEVTGAPSNAPIPEPATMLLFGVGLLGIAGVSRRKRS